MKQIGVFRGVGEGMKEKKMDNENNGFPPWKVKKKRLIPLKDSYLPPPMLLMYTIIQEKLQNILNFLVNAIIIPMILIKYLHIYNNHIMIDYL